MIQSMLDQDVYSFYTQNFILQHFPTTNVRYEFINRRSTDDWDNYPGYNNFYFLDRLTEKIAAMQELRLSEAEFDFLSNLSIFPAEYLQYLKNYRFDMGQVLVGYKDGKFFLDIEGPWHETVLWEVPLLAIISETVFENSKSTLIKQKDLMIQKAKHLNGLKVSDFGTRRRRSFEHQLIAVEMLKKYLYSFTGTSNVHLARICGVKPQGTISHAVYMGASAVHGIENVNRWVSENWLECYKGKVSTALPDTFTTKFFLTSFDWRLSRLYDNIRQDSGNPFKFADLIIKHYKKLGIDPRTKCIVFSDGLNVDKVWDIEGAIQKNIKTAYGVGTFFSNDVVGSDPLQIVIKLKEVETEKDIWKPVIKLSDQPEKYSGSPDEIKHVKSIVDGSAGKVYV